MGDSHTWGAGVERDDAYPGQLQRILDDLEPGLFSVINLGVPGMNTAQVRSRVPEWFMRYEPEVLVVWAGVNNAWNTAEVKSASGSLLAWLDRQLLRSRVYRLGRVRLHDRQLERYAVQRAEDKAWNAVGRRGPPGPIDRHIVEHDGVVEVFEHEKSTSDLGRVEEQTIEDLRAITQYADTASVRTILVTYPLAASTFIPANRAMCEVSRRFDAALVYSAESLDRVPVEDREWLWALHPGAAIYREIARDVAAAVLDPSRSAPRPYECEPDYERQVFAALRAIKSVAMLSRRAPGERGAFAQAADALVPGTGLAGLEPIEPAQLADLLRHPRGRLQLVELLAVSAQQGEAGSEALALIERYAEALDVVRAGSGPATPH
ncbi:MAG: GDSL-type esterase/lipase family protein [Myxococcota bacterium]|nr:GDSL-type esterase/lipase family protein [Myxococcota bacterium]